MVMNVEPIATFRSPFGSKFGVPRQSGLVDKLPGEIIFEPAYRQTQYLRGLEGFDYLWLLWVFSENVDKIKSPTVRPPILGGNERVGVFATRSPFRPNNIGLSSVLLEGIDWNTDHGPVIKVRGADLMDGTPIIDIKPYITYADSHPLARSGFADPSSWEKLEVVFAPSVQNQLPTEELDLLKQVLELDPRPQYQSDPDRIYGMTFGDKEVKFQVLDQVLTVITVALSINEKKL